MKKVPKSVRVLVVLAVVFGGVYAVWEHYYPSGSWRYKMTVEVQTPEGIKTGSAVREVDVACTPQFLPDVIPCIPYVKGEAVVVNLGKRGVLFALMRGVDGNVDYGGNIVYRAFPSGKWNYSPVGVRYYLHLKHARAVLPPALYPMFVYFKNLKDPKTVENVITVRSSGHLGDKGEIAKSRMEEIFGKGVKLKKVTIELTDESVTWGIEKWLPWLPRVLMSYLTGKHIDGPSLYERLYGGDFQMGGKL